jgi:hypothetical protein
MRQVISAPAHLDVSALSQRLAAAGELVRDPSRALVARHGYQTLYEIPVPLQKELRRTLIREHAEALRQRPAAAFDHSVFAWLADWMRWLWSATPAEEWEAVLAEARQAAELSQVIHHVVEAPRAPYDGYRWLDARAGEQAGRLMRGLYVELGCGDRVKEVRL